MGIMVETKNYIMDKDGNMRRNKVRGTENYDIMVSRGTGYRAKAIIEKHADYIKYGMNYALSKKGVTNITYKKLDLQGRNFKIDEKERLLKVISPCMDEVKNYKYELVMEKEIPMEWTRYMIIDGQKKEIGKEKYNDNTEINLIRMFDKIDSRGNVYYANVYNKIKGGDYWKNSKGEKIYNDTTIETIIDSTSMKDNRNVTDEFLATLVQLPRDLWDEIMLRVHHQDVVKNLRFDMVAENIAIEEKVYSGNSRVSQKILYIDIKNSGDFEYINENRYSAVYIKNAKGKCDLSKINCGRVILESGEYNNILLGRTVNYIHIDELCKINFNIKDIHELKKSGKFSTVRIYRSFKNFGDEKLKENKIWDIDNIVARKEIVLKRVVQNKKISLLKANNVEIYESYINVDKVEGDVINIDSFYTAVKEIKGRSVKIRKMSEDIIKINIEQYGTDSNLEICEMKSIVINTKSRKIILKEGDSSGSTAFNENITINLSKQKDVSDNYNEIKIYIKCNSYYRRDFLKKKVDENGKEEIIETIDKEGNVIDKRVKEEFDYKAYLQARKIKINADEGLKVIIREYGN